VLIPPESMLQLEPAVDADLLYEWVLKFACPLLGLLHVLQDADARRCYCKHFQGRFMRGDMMLSW